MQEKISGIFCKIGKTIIKTIKMKRNILYGLVLFFFAGFLFAQQKPTFTAKSLSVTYIPPLSSFDSLPAPRYKEAPEKKEWGMNTVVPGKGLPKGSDPLYHRSRSPIYPPVAQLLTFQTHTETYPPTDPTAAAGPNHYVVAYNIGFKIYDKQGNVLINDTDLSVLFPGYSSDGDPIVIYDGFADRFLIAEFEIYASTPKLLIAVSQTSDPVNGGWFTYVFPMNSMPDYPKYSVWSDGYYVTMNKDASTASSSEVVYALERDKMLLGQTAQIAGFPLPGIVTNGFYSPGGFHVNGSQLPPPGNAPIVYLQDDSWSGISYDHLKIWNINMDWANISNSFISNPQELPVTAFNSVFNNGSFSNLPQPNGTYIDALQGTMMFMTNYRRFNGYNSAVMNFVVNTDGNGKAGIRWYELRQYGDGNPWEVYQEGTYIDPSNKNTFAGSINMDRFGNIGLGYTIVDTDQVPELHYTGRRVADPLNEMTFEPGIVTPGIESDPIYRYGDYAQLTVDPVDDKTFWFISEYFNAQGAVDQVSVFKIAPDFSNDVGISRLITPQDGALGSTETVSVLVSNFGLSDQSSFNVSYQIDNNPVVTETFTDTLDAQSATTYVFSVPADLSEEGRTYRVKAWTDLPGDEDRMNDTIIAEITHLYTNDIGISNFIAPQSGSDLGANEPVTVMIENFGTAGQSGFPVSYQVNNNPVVTEIFNDTLAGGETVEFTFSQTIDLSNIGSYLIRVYTGLANDSNRSNDTLETTVEKYICQPSGNCNYGDAIMNFQFGGIDNSSGCSSAGYADYTNMVAQVSRNSTENLSVEVGYSDDHLTVWVDFNDNFVFEDTEKIILDEVIPAGNNGTYVGTYPVTIPAQAQTGEHLLRARINWSNPVPDACSDVDYGETEDYKVNITDPGAVDPLATGRMTVKTLPGKKFVFIIESDTYRKNLIFTAYNTAGQQIAYHILKNVNGTYVYTLDMSYMPAGVYLVRIGNEETGKITKIIVK